MSMEAFAAARKQKLALLRKRKADEEAGVEVSGSPHDAGLMIKRHFRNYDPITGQMKRFTSVKDLPDTIEKDVEGLQQQILEEDEQRRLEDLDLTNIAPKRPNWDLKRDLEKRLKKLERRDKEAILTLIRQRIQSQQKATGADGDESSVTALGAEIVASTTADVGTQRQLLSTNSDDDDDDDDQEQDSDLSDQDQD
ncbi:cwf18-domain-containing protein [Testicularia cyperi]|uniref:Cwf18-domain-containing protein n=1 Tax=Testicularia cyperi TaxID=1882483 RepID=A0A317XJE3_9BASI|nr:cwf18-domain-containing protein [Testicularia cyperi]